jgi:hypothetical protein
MLRTGVLVDAGEREAMTCLDARRAMFTFAYAIQTEFVAIVVN